mmetsp:Transcript_256/g.525  ORF Transcript_256/g.525 Transcript_256/m.525 type:complete len:211 (+) Transcript_256:2189-2821(+)
MRGPVQSLLCRGSDCACLRASIVVVATSQSSGGGGAGEREIFAVLGHSGGVGSQVGGALGLLQSVVVLGRKKIQGAQRHDLYVVVVSCCCRPSSLDGCGVPAGLHAPHRGRDPGASPPRHGHLPGAPVLRPDEHPGGGKPGGRLEGCGERVRPEGRARVRVLPLRRGSSEPRGGRGGKRPRRDVSPCLHHRRRHSCCQYRRFKGKGSSDN